jgi:hypothetical protein
MARTMSDGTDVCIRCRDTFRLQSPLTHGIRDWYCPDCITVDVELQRRLAGESAGPGILYGVSTLARPSTPVALPVARPGDNIIRGRRGYFREVSSKAWGTRIEACEDPAGTDPDLSAFKLPGDFPLVPSVAWYAYVNLAFRYMAPPADGAPDQPDTTSELAVVFTRRRPDLRAWDLWVPRQTVGGARVDYATGAPAVCHLLTGEEHPDWLPEDRAYAGSSHSHNSMGAFFSAADDRDELSKPGLHIVIGSLINHPDGRRTYTVKARIVQMGREFAVPFRSVVDTALPDGAPVSYHPRCVEYVTKHAYAPPASTSTPAASRTYRGDDTPLPGWLRGWRDATGTPPAAPRGKVSPIPLAVQLALADARKSADELGGGQRGAVRAACNGVERCAGHPAAMRALLALCGDLLLAQRDW